MSKGIMLILKATPDPRGRRLMLNGLVMKYSIYILYIIYKTYILKTYYILYIILYIYYINLIISYSCLKVNRHSCYIYFVLSIDKSIKVWYNICIVIKK